MTIAQAAKRSAKTAPHPSKQDLRTWLDALRAAGELQDISGAEREAEIGGIVDVYMRKMGNPAVLFDDIPGYLPGHRILANILTSVRRINLTLGLPIDGSAMELVSYWRKYMKEAPSIAPIKVKSGPLMENVSSGKDINIQSIPTPRWHEHDGGYYIGTGCMVIMKDPDTGWINYGAYRVQSHGPNVATVMCSKGKHGDLIKRRYHERGEPCPIAVVAGMHPALFMVGGLEIPYGKNEYDVAGGLIGEPVEVINGPRTGLPVPAHAEIAFEGFIHPNDLLEEGPLGEWTGYYAGGQKKEPAIRFELIPHLPLRCGVESARSGRRAGGERRVGACGRRQPALAHGLDQAAICRSRQAGRTHRLAMPCRRLRQPFRGGGRRRRRSCRHGSSGVGDVHALRSPRRHRDPARLLEHRARPHGLWHRRSTQCPRGH